MIWQEPPRGVSFPRELAARPGIEQVAALVDGEVGPPPIHYLTGMGPTAIGPATSEFRMPATGWLASPTGQIQGGVLAILGDGPLGCAIQSELGPGTGYTTADLSMSYLRPALPDGGELVARGRAVHVGRSLALSDVLIQDASGRNLAHGTSRCFVFPPVEVPDPPPPLPARDDGTHTTPAPFEREPEGELTPVAEWRERTGLELLRGWISGDVPAPPISHLTGQHPVAASEGSATFVMPASGWLASPSGFVEGGTLVMLADSALISAVQSTLPAGTGYAPVDITVKFLRPVPPDGTELTATAKVIQAGRTLAVSECQIANAAGKLVCVAIGTTMILPGRDMTSPIAPADEPAGTD